MTMKAIIAVAERLFARFGIDGVSMRQISQEAGSGNHFSVHYHFGDKKSLAEAIMPHRMSDFDHKRGELLSQVTKEGQLSNPQALLRALLLPYTTQTDKHGEHSYAAFAIHLYWHSDIPMTWLTSPDFAAVARPIIELLSMAVNLPLDLFDIRLRTAVVSFLHVVVECDRSGRKGQLQRPVAEIWDDAIMAAGVALEAPAAIP